MNIPYEMFLTIQMHLTCRKYHIIITYKQRIMKTCFEEQVTTFQNNMTSVVTSLMQNLPATKKKGKTSSRRMMSRMQYGYMKEIS